MEIARSVLQVGNDELKDSKGKKPKYRLPIRSHTLTSSEDFWTGSG